MIGLPREAYTGRTAQRKGKKKAAEANASAAYYSPSLPVFTRVLRRAMRRRPRVGRLRRRDRSGSSETRVLLHEPAEILGVGVARIDIAGVVRADAFERTELLGFRNEGADLLVLDV